jgi:hypothetical protein
MAVAVFLEAEIRLLDHERLRSAVEDIERSALCRRKIAVLCVSGVSVIIVL